ncbi:MAG: acetate kinase [Actinomycetota bacterium]
MAWLSRVLVVNAGSSSLKVSVLDEDDVIVTTLEVRDWDGEDTSALGRVTDCAGPIDVVGHRVVHGGPDLREPVVLDATTEAVIESLTPLAPLHQARALAGIRAARQVCKSIPAVACFDTAFHATLPVAAATYALPLEWRRLGVRRYGFHGLSHAWASRRAAAMLERPIEGLRMVSAHLGAGASLCAVAGGVSIDTTMGFTPLEGLVMATRAGSVDPGALLWLQREHGISAREIEAGLEEASGLLGLFGGSGDMRDVEAGVDRGDDDARLAYDVYLHRLRSSIGAMAASLEGLDVLVFTGGTGEHSARVRADACSGLAHLGVGLDQSRNTAAVPDADVSGRNASVATLVIAAREDRQIAREARQVLSGFSQAHHS